MADFCKECSADQLGVTHTNDLKGLCPEGEFVRALCEGCGGFITVDHTGQRVHGMYRQLKKVPQ